MITVPIDQTVINPEEATVIIYHEQGFTDEFKVFLDKTKLVGIVTAETPLRFSVSPGEHELHTEVTMAIDRVIKQKFIAGAAYYFTLWLDMGMWVSSIRITPTESTGSYQVNSYRQ